jgi:hypothetical protein
MKYLKMLGLAAVAAMALMAFAASASATTLEVNGVTQNKSVSLESTLKAGTSAILKDEFGTTTDTCTVSTVSGSTTKFDPPSGPVSALTFSSCTHTTTVIAKGNLSVAWTSGTNGTVSSNGAEVTVQSTFFGASAVCKTGDATVDINAKINCGILGASTWTGTYTVTKVNGVAGAGLGVEN